MCDCDIEVCRVDTACLAGVDDIEIINVPNIRSCNLECDCNRDICRSGKLKLIYTNKLILMNLPCGIGGCRRDKDCGCEDNCNC